MEFYDFDFTFTTAAVKFRTVFFCSSSCIFYRQEKQEQRRDGYKSESYAVIIETPSQIVFELWITCNFQEKDYLLNGNNKINGAVQVNFGNTRVGRSEADM